MAKNLIPEIARMLGVEICEEFKIEGNARTYFFDLDGLHSGDHVAKDEDNATLCDILCGDAEIVKMPWKPQMFETYRSFDIVYGKLVVCFLKWTGLPYQYALLDKGWVFRTQEEAKSALPKVAAEIGVEYKI